MVDNSNMPHPKCLGSQKNPGTEPKTCEKEPKLGFEYLPTSKTLHCVRTACMAFPIYIHDFQSDACIPSLVKHALPAKLLHIEIGKRKFSERVQSVAPLSLFNIQILFNR